MAVYTHITETQSIFNIQTPTFAFESGTFSYNFLSADILTVYDFGSILDAVIEEEDYHNNSLIDAVDSYEDYGSIPKDTKPVFGELDLNSATIIGFSLSDISSGVAFALQGGSISAFGTPYIGYDGNIFDINDSYNLTFSHNYEGSGDLSTIIGASERVSSSFNISSVALFLREDYNLISKSEEEEEDYEYIYNRTLYSFEDYNTITIRAQDNPYGLFKVAGNASKFIRFSLTTNDPITQAIQYHGHGNEAITPFIPPGSGKFGISGGLSKESFIPTSIIGSGSLFNFITKEERSTFSYNSSSQVIVKDEDFGFINESSPSISSYANTLISDIADEVVSTFTVTGIISADDFGIISELVNRPDSEDFGLLTTVQRRPFGFSRFIGDASRSIIFTLTANPEGGTLFGIGGSADALAKVYPVVSNYTDNIIVTAEDIALNPSTVLENTSLYQNGSGFGSAGGFNIGPHIRFGTFSQDGSRSVRFRLDLRDVGDITISAIKGNGSNGGDSPEANESLRIEFIGVSGNQIVVAENDTSFNTLNEKTITVPVGARNRYQEVSLYQEGNSGNEYDHYGFKSLQYDFVTLPEIKTLSNITGTATERIAIGPQIGTGTLFNFVTKEERRTFSYNGSSVVDQDNIDFGFISEAHVDQDDFGIISELVNRPDSEDFGFISTVQNRPYGSLRFEGDNAKTTRFRVRHIGSGSLFTFDSSTEISSQTDDTKVLFTVSGECGQKLSPAVVGSGSLFNIITTDKSRTFSYNGSSVTGTRINDYRLINESAVEFEDYGTVTDFPESGIYDTITYHQEDYGLISVPVGETRRPFGRFGFSGKLEERITPAPHVGSGSLFTFDSNTQVSFESFSATPPASVLFSVSGSAKEQLSPAIVGSGSLFNFITKDERRTFSYNGSSVISQEDIDFGFISEASVEQDDFGIISELVNRPDSEDFGLISTVQRRPYGSLRFSGNASKLIRFSLRTIQSGSLFGFGGANESITPFIPAREGLLRFAGSLTERFTPAPAIGSGSLFNFITKEERRTFSYNGSSQVIVEDEDFGFITNVAVTSSPFISSYANTPISTFANEIIAQFGIEGNSEDFGIISELVNRPDSEDFGLLTTVQRRPFGFLRFSGAVQDVKNTEAYKGSGTLFALSSATESVGPKPPVAGVIRVLGSAAEATVPTAEIGSGTLFSFVSKKERRTYRYTGSSIVYGIINLDYGFISGAENLAIAGLPLDEDYGDITLPNTPNESDDYQYLSPTPLDKRPYGRFRFSGAVQDVKNTEAYKGSGTLFALSSSTESTGVKPPTTGLFKFHSDTRESLAPAPHVGTGIVSARRKSTILDPEGKERLISATESTAVNLDIPASGFKITAPPVRIYFEYGERGTGRFTIAGKALIRLNPVHYGRGRIAINGIGNESITPFIPPGSGSLFSFVNGEEATTPATHIGSGKLFTIRGSATDISKTNVQIGSGLTRINIETGIKFILDFPGSGSLFTIVTTKDRKVNTFVGSGLFRINSESENYFTNRFISFAEPIITRGQAETAKTKVKTGSGTLFALSSSTESTGANPPDRTLPVRLVGESENARTFNEIGVGSFSIKENRILHYYKGEISSYIISDYGNIPISTYADTSISEFSELRQVPDKYRLVSADESFSSNPPEEGTLSRVFGDSELRITIKHKASGSIFGFGGGAESIGANPPDRTLPVRLVGESDNSRTVREIGTGSLFGFNGSSESTTAAPPEKEPLIKITGSLEESFTPASHVTTGSIFTFISGTNSRTTSEDKRVLFNINGISFQKNIIRETGSGRIPTIIGSSRSVAFDYTLNQKILKIFGTKLESFARSNYNGSCQAEFIGESSDRTIEFEDSKPTRIYII
jgi:hypothetical protein